MVVFVGHLCLDLHYRTSQRCLMRRWMELQESLLGNNSECITRTNHPEKIIASSFNGFLLHLYHIEVKHVLVFEGCCRSWPSMKRDLGFFSLFCRQTLPAELSATFLRGSWVRRQFQLSLNPPICHVGSVLMSQHQHEREALQSICRLCEISSGCGRVGLLKM